jgi:hypothetical protein
VNKVEAPLDCRSGPRLQKILSPTLVLCSPTFFIRRTETVLPTNFASRVINQLGRTGPILC